MKNNVIICIRGTQFSPDSEPETIELTTDGTMERDGDTVTLSYQESDLTGLGDTTTVFRVSPNRILLERSGAVESVMEFEEGKSSDSLYRIDEGVLLLRVFAKKMCVHFDGADDYFDLTYGIEIENSPMGEIDYHITVKPA